MDKNRSVFKLKILRMEINDRRIEIWWVNGIARLVIFYCSYNKRMKWCWKDI